MVLTRGACFNYMITETRLFACEQLETFASSSLPSFFSVSLSCFRYCVELWYWPLILLNFLHVAPCGAAYTCTCGRRRHYWFLCCWLSCPCLGGGCPSTRMSLSLQKLRKGKGRHHKQSGQAKKGLANDAKIEQERNIHQVRRIQRLITIQDLTSPDASHNK